MVRTKLGYIAFFIGILLCFHSFGQRHVFTEVKANSNRVYLGEPAEIALTVYTSTWFTKGLDLPNIKVEGAFTVKFRSISVSKRIDGQNYAGVQFIYHVFPFHEKDVEFPAMTIEVETPDKDDYVGKKRKVNSRSLPIRVRPIIPGFDEKDWLVTTSLIVRDHWQGDLKNVKVGDVIERSIYRKAEGTVSELIPPIEWDSITGVSLYPERGIANNNKTKTSINADRTDVMRYLFEREGEIVIPEMTLFWWDAAREKMYKKTLPQQVVNVQPNPDLGMLESIKDSLALVHSEQAEETHEDEPFSCLGMDWRQLLLAIAGMTMALRYLIKYALKATQRIKSNRSAYLVSERYYFHQFLKALHSEQSSRDNAFYRWIDCLELPEYTYEYFNKKFLRAEARNEFPTKKKLWITARERYMMSFTNKGLEESSWINPS